MICQSGGRAAKACERLRASGVTNVFNINFALGAAGGGGAADPTTTTVVPSP